MLQSRKMVVCSSVFWSTCNIYGIRRIIVVVDCLWLFNHNESHLFGWAGFLANFPSLMFIPFQSHDLPFCLSS